MNKIKNNITTSKREIKMSEEKAVEKAEEKVTQTTDNKEVAQAQDPKQINTKKLIGLSLQVLAVTPDELEIVDNEKSTKTERVMKKIPVINCVMGFKVDDTDLAMYIIQKGVNTNIINITNL